MKQAHFYNDEALTAFLDGELDADKTADMKQALARNVALQQRLDQLIIDKSEMKNAFDSLLAQAPSQAVLLSKKQTQASPKWLQSTIAACVLGLCVSIGLLFNYNNITPWHQSVAEYQALYISRTLSHIATDSTEKAQELARVKMVMGKSFPLEKLNNLTDLDYKRAQILGFEGQPLIQLAFLSKLDTPVALCVIKAQPQTARAIHTTSIKGMAAASWTQKGYDYLLIGGQDQAFIKHQAIHFSTML